MPIEYLDQPPPTAELVIIGGGVVGAATALHAARAGLRPLIVERRPHLCTLTTAAAAGGFRLQLDNQEELRLVSESAELFLNFAELTGQRRYDPKVRQAGYLWATTGERRAEQQRRLVDQQRRWGLDDVEILDGDTARRAFPFLSPEVVQARFRQGDGLLDPKALTFGLAAGAGAAVLAGCTVTGFTIKGGRLVAVQTSAGDIACQAAVIAAGPFSGRVAGLAGIDLPVHTVRRQKVVLPDVPQVPAHAPMVVDDDSGAHWRPAFGGAFLLFTDPATPPSPPLEDLPPEPGFAFRLLDPASPQAVARIAPFWSDVWHRGGGHWMLQAGQYTMTPDRRPLIGPSALEGLHVNTGYCGRGVMGGPAGSRILIDALTGTLASEDNPFGPDRTFAGQDERPRLDPL